MSLLIRHPPGDGKKTPLLDVLPFAVPFSITLNPNEKKCVPDVEPDFGMVRAS